MKKRSEIEEKYKWDLSKFCKSDEDFYKRLKKLDKEIAKISAFEGHLAESNEKLFECLELNQKFGKEHGFLYIYANLKLKTDNAKILVDGNKKIRNFDAPMETVIKGDAKSASIAAASILAKVSRDRFMLELDKQFPQYHWAKNKGYLSAEHIAAIKTHGPTVWHRKKFLRNILAEEKQLSLLQSSSRV